MARRRINLSPIVTNHFPISSIKEAFDLVLRKDRGAIGIVFDWK
jgi:threonine dehydrogenase-like Zn-dependent dehydrogenase